MSFPQKRSPRLANSLSGAATSTFAQACAGTLTMSGTLQKQTSKTMAGTLTSAGALLTAAVRKVSMSGTLTSAGALTTAVTLLSDIFRRGLMTRTGSRSGQ